MLLDLKSYTQTICTTSCANNTVITAVGFKAENMSSCTISSTSVVGEPNSITCNVGFIP